MKIAIITWFRNYNYGTYLQAYCLQQYLKEHNHEPTLIKYRSLPGDTLREPIRSVPVFLNKIRNNIKRRLDEDYYKKIISSEKAAENKKKEIKMNCFLNDVSFTKEMECAADLDALEDQFDCFICGSDQIWNPKLLNGRYYLNFVKKKPKIAYGGSFSLDFLPEFAVPYIKEWTKDFLAIGMREQTGAMIVSHLGRTSQNVCDPTLLLYEYWKSQKFEPKINDPYIFSYFLGSRRYYRRVLDVLTRKCKGKVVSVPMNNFGVRHGDVVDFSCGVEDFLSYIQNAEYVCVDSFHAVVFSIIYEKQFVVVNKFRDGDLSSQNSRIIDFLRVLGLEDRIVSEKQVKKLDTIQAIDYLAVNERLHRFINDSQEFLLEALRKAEERRHDM